MLFIHYPKCSTCKRAQAWLDANGIQYESRHIKEQPPTAAELAAWHAQSGQPLRRFFNTSGILYREMQLSAKLPEMSEKEQLALLASDGMLIKRPLLITDKAVLIGFREKAWEAALQP